MPGDIAPQNMSSTMGGLQNTAGNIGGVLAPIITGGIVSATGSFVAALAFSGFVTLLGALSFGLLLGKVQPIVAPTNEDN